MADTKISALSAASVVVAANEFAINEAGTSKKVTAAQIKTFTGLLAKKLSADLANSTTTFAKVTNLDQATTTGTWAFKYLIRYQTNTTTTGIKFAVNYTGTVTSFVASASYVEATTGTLVGTGDQAHITFGQIAGGAARAKSATVAVVQTAAVDTINVDMLMAIEGLMVVTVAGNIELYSASEAATTSTVKQDSVLILTRVD